MPVPGMKADAAIAPLLRSIRVHANHLEVQPYTKLQTLFDAAWPPGRLYYDKSAITRRRSDAAIECLIEHGRTMPTPPSAIAFQQLHGAAARVGVTETAFPHRFDHLGMYVHPATDYPAEADTYRSGGACWCAPSEFTTQPCMSTELRTWPKRAICVVQDAYGANYGRVVALKKQDDPTNFLSANANVRPSS